MRRSSSTSSVTSQPSSERRIPSTPSTGRPVSAPSCWTAARATSIEPSLPLVLLALPRLAAGTSTRLQALEQLVLQALELGLLELAALEGRLEARELGAHLRRLVEVALGLVLDLLGDPHRPAHGRERERQQPRDQAHAPASWSSASSTK